MFGQQNKPYDNPHKPLATSLKSLVKGLYFHRHLLGQLIKREILGRYKGSAFGLAWSFFNPIVMLAIYTIVFSEIFKSRWPGTSATESKGEFAVLLFIGMIVINLFSEVINRAPSIILANVNFVKKVVFPIEILPVVATGAAVFHFCISFLVLIFAFYFLNGFLQWTTIFVPLILFPLIIFTLGIAWILSSLGVFLRDVSQTVGLLTTMLMFLSPVFYPLESVPVNFRYYIMMNPLTFIIEQTRAAVVWGRIPDWFGLSIYFVVSLVIAWLGFFWFQKTRKGFADVL